MEYDLEGLVSAVRGIADASFPDLGFLDSSGELDIDAEVSRVQAVRVELQSTEFLHLGTIRLVTASEPPDAASTELRVSSIWKGYGEHLSKKLVLDPEFDGTGFHTKKEQRPWLEIALDSPIDLRRIMIRNRPGPTARRARGILVRVRTTDGRWITVYDGLVRANAFARSIEHIFGAVTDVSSTECGAASPLVAADLANLLARLHLHDYAGPALARDLARIPISAEDQGRFRDLVSDSILYPRQLEWTGHGVKRSFRFWSRVEKAKYVAYATELVDDLHELTPNVCLGFGSVLAAVRDHDLIPHDDDLDIVVGFEPEEAPKIADALQLIAKHLRAKGYTVMGNNTAHRMISRPPHRKVDVFVGIFENDQIAWYPASRSGLPRDVVFPPMTTDLLGAACAIPAKPEEYLQRVYGRSWSTPDRHFKHAGDRQAYADILR